MIQQMLILIIAVMALVWINTNFAIVKVDGTSMVPTFKDRQLLLLDKKNYSIEKNDVVVFIHDDLYKIKRIVGLPGDAIELKDNTVFRNNIPLSPYTYSGEPIRYELAETEYFVIGDNYVFSEDSRDYGPVNLSDICGKVFY